MPARLGARPGGRFSLPVPARRHWKCQWMRCLWRSVRRRRSDLRAHHRSAMRTVLLKQGALIEATKRKGHASASGITDARLELESMAKSVAGPQSRQSAAQLLVLVVPIDSAARSHVPEHTWVTTMDAPSRPQRTAPALRASCSIAKVLWTKEAGRPARVAAPSHNASMILEKKWSESLPGPARKSAL